MGRWVTTLDGVAFDLDDPSTVPPPWELLRPTTARLSTGDSLETVSEAARRLRLLPMTLLYRARARGVVPPAKQSRARLGVRLSRDAWDAAGAPLKAEG